MRLMRFVCSMAWADLKVAQEERSMVTSLIKRLELEPDERRRVVDWLRTPPRAETVDPTSVPMEHRELFRAALRRVVESDGSISDEERVALHLFDQLVA